MTVGMVLILQLCHVVLVSAEGILQPFMQVTTRCRQDHTEFSPVFCLVIFFFFGLLYLKFLRRLALCFESQLKHYIKLGSMVAHPSQGSAVKRGTQTHKHPPSNSPFLLIAAVLYNQVLSYCKHT